MAAECFHYYSTLLCYGAVLSASWQHSKLPISSTYPTYLLYVTYIISTLIFSVFFSRLKKPTYLENSSFCLTQWSNFCVFCLSFVNPFCFRELHHLHERGIRSSLRERPQNFTLKRYLICVRKKKLRTTYDNYVRHIGLCDSWMRGKY